MAIIKLEENLNGLRDINGRLQEDNTRLRRERDYFKAEYNKLHNYIKEKVEYNQTVNNQQYNNQQHNQQQYNNNQQHNNQHTNNYLSPHNTSNILD